MYSFKIVFINLISHILNKKQNHNPTIFNTQSNAKHPITNSKKAIQYTRAFFQATLNHRDFLPTSNNDKYINIISKTK